MGFIARIFLFIIILSACNTDYCVDSFVYNYTCYFGTEAHSYYVEDIELMSPKQAIVKYKTRCSTQADSIKILIYRKGECNIHPEPVYSKTFINW